MIKTNSGKERDKYLLKYKMNDIFSIDMEPYMELFFYKKSEFIIKESEDINYLLFLVKGKAKAYITLSNGKSLLLCFYHEFMLLGDLEMIDSKKAASNVQVIEDTYCIGISIENVKAYLLNDAKFLRFVCSSLGNKLERCAKNSSINLLYSLENRLASYMLTTGESIIEANQEKIIINEHLIEIAELLGTSYRHLLRTINALCLKEVIKKKKNYYEVIDVETLKMLSADLYQ